MSEIDTTCTYRRAARVRTVETDDRRPARCQARAAGSPPARPRAPSADNLLVREGDIAADYLERLLDIVDYDGDIDLDVENDRAAVAIVGSDLQSLVGAQGETLDALQELTRLAVAAADRRAQPADARHQRAPPGPPCGAARSLPRTPPRACSKPASRPGWRR